MKQIQITKSQWPDIVILYKNGLPQKDVGEKCGVSGARIQQILKASGIDSFLGGASLRSFDKTRTLKTEEKKRRDERSFSTYGCSHADAVALNGNKKISDRDGIAFRYLQQRINANRRGIEFNISFPDWIAFWQDSGQLANRGRGQGCCMARIADHGAYELGNIYACTIGENFSHSYISSPWQERHKKRSHLENKGAA